ncbi:MAG: MaoC family dehydratase [Desulfobacteraceae bacterium]|jgi:3-hydroxybutyryl-CoA dehydratase|nr:MaoC family dehydratase [Desulfobacteraceae bacterium]
MIGKTIEELKVGDTAKFSKTVSESDVYLFAGVTGDLNPAHVSEEFAKDTFFKTRIAHGMLSASFISTVIGTMMPGPGSVYMRQEANFLAPVKFGDTITAIVEVAEIIADKKRVRLKTYCINQEKTVVVDGEALVSPPRAPKND